MENKKIPLFTTKAIQLLAQAANTKVGIDRAVRSFASLCPACGQSHMENSPVGFRCPNCGAEVYY
jgi:predicted RNA-binding Zn-ribbon protein involved in translation (DUF1610 family)